MSALIAMNMTHEQAAAHLRHEVMDTARFETGRLVSPQEPALFGAVRAVMSDLEYVAALYYGWNGKRRDKIATREKTIRFVREVMSDATGDEGYRLWAEHLYTLYRTGLVHLRMPKVLTSPTSSTPCLGWALMYERADHLSEANGSLQVEHLHLCRTNDRVSHLPVSIKALFDDFLLTCERFAADLDAEGACGGTELIRRWDQTTNALADPEDTPLTW
jgi:hypothetical protein